MCQLGESLKQSRNLTCLFGAQMLGWGETGNEETNSKVTPAEPAVMRKWNQVTAERRAGWKDGYLGESFEEGPVFDMTHAWCGGTSCVKNRRSTSLVAEWIRVHLPKQGTWVRSLVPEDPTCSWATKPVCCKYWTNAPQLLSLHAYSLCPVTRKVISMRSQHSAKTSSPPLATTRESPCKAVKIQCSHKKIKEIKTEGNTFKGKAKARPWWRWEGGGRWLGRASEGPVMQHKCQEVVTPVPRAA